MSNAMSRSKSRWKAALLATVAGAVVSPLAANAQSLTVSLDLSPLGSSGPFTNEYIAPNVPVPIYVYATVTGSTTISPSEIDGLQYLYYDVNAVRSSSSSTIGSITGATLSPLFSGNGSQSGNISAGAYTATSSIALGDSSVLPNIAKPRASSAVYSTNTASGVVVNGNSVSFLVETLTYTPTFTPKPALANSADSTSFSLSIPTLGVPYTGANYFANLTSQPTGSVGAANTFSAYNASSQSVTLYDAEQGDVNLDGVVNGADLAVLASHYNTATSGWTNGDLNGDGFVNGTDLAEVASNYNIQYGLVSPSVIASATALIAADGGSGAVPEPTSLGFLAVAGLGLLRRRGRHLV